MAFETSRADQPADPPYPTTDRFALSPERRADRARRTPTLLLRRTSTMSLWARVDLQVERDALVHRLARIDRRLSVLTDERLAIVAELAQIRDDLYPVVHWCHGRRPPGRRRRWSAPR